MQRLAAHCTLTDNEHGGVLLNKKSGQYYSLNPTAIRVLQELAKGRKPEEIAEDLSRDYGQPPEATAQDVQAILARLTELEVLEESA